MNPEMQGRGHGQSIVRHLIGEAAILAHESAACHGVLFLDVYATNVTAIGLYGKCGFIRVGDQPRLDPDENDRPYIIMALRVSVAPD